MARWLCEAELPFEVNPHHEDEDSFEFCMTLKDGVNLSFLSGDFVCEVHFSKYTDLQKCFLPLSLSF